MSLLLSVREKGVQQMAAPKKGRHSAIQGKDWKALQQKVLERDNLTCQYCGFKADKFQRVANINGQSQSIDDFKTVCIFCDQCINLEAAASQASGILAWLPEIGQIELHHLCRSIYALRREESNPAAEAASNLLDKIMVRRTEAKRRIGTDDPLVLAIVLLENLTEEEYRNRETKLSGIRLVPLPRRIVYSPSGEVDQFPDILSYWTSQEGPLASAAQAHWPALYQKLTPLLG